MIQNERDCRHEHVLGVARQMMTAARTAPKGKGVDVIEAALVTGEDLRMNWLKDCKTVFAIPVSASSKNPFFDRKPKEEKK